jgi:hypothetical protein
MAAEILDRFAADVHGDPGRQQAASVPLSRQGLGARPRSLDAALTHLHLSPHPALVVGVEGATEMLLVPRVMELLGIERDPSWIRVEDFGGTDKDLSLLARYASQPLLGEDRGDHVVLDRPPTRFLVMTDAEHRYKTLSDRSQQRKLLLDSITQYIPADLRADLYRRNARVVEIVTWGRLPFEFAHFTDRQLADALLQAAAASHPRGRAALIWAIHMQRVKDPTPNIEDAWKRSGVKKVQLAEVTWPLLKRRIERAIVRGHRGPPIMRAVLRAYELASLSYQLTTVIERHPARRPRR